MKQYMLFMFESNYPAGGALDFIQDFDELNGAAQYLREFKRASEIGLPIWHVFDTERRCIAACSAWIRNASKSNKPEPEESYGGQVLEDGVGLCDEAELVLDIDIWRVG